MKPADIEVGKTYGNSLGKTRKVDEIKQWVSYPDDDAIVWFIEENWRAAIYLTDFARWAETELTESNSMIPLAKEGNTIWCRDKDSYLDVDADWQIPPYLTDLTCWMEKEDSES